MNALNLKSLIAKLNPICHQALESAAGLCLSRTHYNVEVEHWFSKMLDVNDTDLLAIFRHFEIDQSRLTADLTTSIDRLKTGNSRPPALSPDVVQLVRHAWLVASVNHSDGLARTGHVLLAMLSDDTLRRLAMSISRELDKVSTEKLTENFANITGKTSESSMTAAGKGSGAAAASSGGSGGGAPIAGQSTQALDQFTIDLTQSAWDGKIDPVLGRDPEVRQIVDILTRRRQNNPILTGEAGVGKTAVVEGFAQRVVDGDVPPDLKNIRLLSLDLGLLQAGASVKGEFENRLKNVIQEVKSSPTPIILFVDEAHTLIGAGGAAGQNDAANLLKPALARGELRTIAATTWAEYKKYFEKDPALTRRFQVVKVEEPNEDIACQMMRGLAKTLEKHHGVRILDEAVVEAVRLSQRYIVGRQLPDKSVSLLDTASARVAISRHATPSAIEDLNRRLNEAKNRVLVLRREGAATGDHTQEIEAVLQDQTDLQAELESLTERHEQETKLVDEIIELRQKLEDTEGEDAVAQDVDTLRKEYAAKSEALKELQGEAPLVTPFVDGQAVADIVSNWTGVPVGRMVGDEINTVLNLAEAMKGRIIGQNHALTAIGKSVRTARAKLKDERKPTGVFLFVGTSGVGKTETAIALADLLYGGEQNMTTINMSEFKEEHKVSLLMGSPPGYVGYGEGGVLTEAVRRKPYSVVLLDEMEKAHNGVQDVFYQVFDKGNMKDGEGRDIDFKNTVLIMTSNAASDQVRDLCADPELMPEPDKMIEAIYPELLKTFKPAFLGRCTIIPYYPLAPEVMKQIVRLQLNRIVKRVKANYGCPLTYTDALVDAITARCTEVETGGRNIDNIVNKTLLPDMSERFLQKMAEGDTIDAVEVTADEDGNFVYNLTGAPGS